MTIGVELEDDDGANGLTEGWVKVKRVYWRHDKKRTGISSTTTWPTSGGQKRVTSEDTLPPREERSSWKDSTVHKEAVISDEILKMQVDTEGNPMMEAYLREMNDKEEVTSYQLRTKDVSETNAEVRYFHTTGQGVDQHTLSSCDHDRVKLPAVDTNADLLVLL